MSFSIRLPNRNDSGDVEDIDLPGHLVLIGANGAGKTRLGIWIEENNRNQHVIHRISAQKALSIPEYAQLRNLEQAEKDLILGRPDQHASTQRIRQDRWGDNPATYLLNDYDKLLSVLFARQAARDCKHSEDTRTSQSYVPVPDSPLDTIVNIWAGIMPHRKIRFSDGKVIVNKIDEPEYHGKEMSDGERVILYLIGQCLCAPANAIIIVDEPEMHLHKSVVDKLWNRIEELCQGKKIIYITHDLGFAASRMDASKLWVRSYSGDSRWTWAEVPDAEPLPESLVLEVIGNRKRVMFCEGDAGSFDVSMYQIAYPAYHVIPRGSCAKVIESTKALRNNASLHQVDAVGVIDTDYRDAQEINALRSHGIHTIAVAEIENLFCVESVIRIIADHLSLDANEMVCHVKRSVVAALKSELELQITSAAERRIQYLLQAFSTTSNDKSGLTAGLQRTLAHINVERIYDECNAAFEKAITSNELDQLLRIYNRKSLPNRISGCFGLGNGQYQKLVIRLMKGPHRHSIVDAIMRYMPSI